MQTKSSHSPPGRDFKPTVVLSVNDQVDKLIAQATSLENLSQNFIGYETETLTPSSSSSVLTLLAHITQVVSILVARPYRRRLP